MELSKRRVILLAENDYEDLELWYPKLRLIEAGAEVTVVGVGEEVYYSKHGYPVTVDGKIKDFESKDFDAVVIPGGWAPDRMRRYPELVNFVKEMNDSGKVVAAICHGPSVLVSAGVLKGKKATCFIAIKDDVVNAGAEYLDKPVVVDGNLITSRKPNDLPDFCREIINALKYPEEGFMYE